MYEQLTKPKNVVKIVIAIVSLFLVSMFLQETFSSYVDPDLVVFEEGDQLYYEDVGGDYDQFDMVDVEEISDGIYLQPDDGYGLDGYYDVDGYYESVDYLEDGYEGEALGEAVEVVPAYEEIMPINGGQDILRLAWRANGGNDHLALDPSSNTRQSHVLELEFSPQSTNVYAPREIEIRLPRGLFKDRDGNVIINVQRTSAAGANSLPMFGIELPLPGDTSFDYRVYTDEIVIYNFTTVTGEMHLRIPMGINYLPSQSPNGFRNDGIQAHVMFANHHERDEVESNQISLDLTTRVVPREAGKRVLESRSFWSSAWGEAFEQNGVNQNGYFYVRYRIWHGFYPTTTAPFVAQVVEMPLSSGEIIAWSTISTHNNDNGPAILPNIVSHGTTAEFNAESARIWSIQVPGGATADGGISANQRRFQDIVVRYPRMGVPDQAVQNSVKVIFTPIDYVSDSVNNPIISRDREVEYIYNSVGFSYQGDLFAVHTSMGVVWSATNRITDPVALSVLEGGFNRGMGFFTDYETSAHNSRWSASVTARGFGFTEGGEKPFRTTLFDDQLYLQTSTGVHELLPGDYRFTRVRIGGYTERIPVKDGNGEILETRLLPMAERSAIRLYYRTVVDGWQYLTTFDPSDANQRRGNTDNSIDFNLPETNVYQIKAVHNNGLYEVQFALQFGFELIPTPRVLNLIEGEETVRLRNFAALIVEDYTGNHINPVNESDYLGTQWERFIELDQVRYGHLVQRWQDYSYLGRVGFSTIMEKGVRGGNDAIESDATNARMVIPYRLAIQNSTAETNSLSDELFEMFVLEITEGVFYDLLPPGVLIDENSVIARDAYGRIVEHRVVQTSNWQGSGRTLVSIYVETIAGTNLRNSSDELDLFANVLSGSGFIVDFDAIYPWMSVAFFGTNLRNVASFQSRSGALFNGHTNGENTAGNLTDAEREFMSNFPNTYGIDPDERNTASNFTTNTVSPLIPTQLGFRKMVRATGDLDYLTETSVRLGGIYSYRLQYFPLTEDQTSNLVMFDVLEAAQGDRPYWQGTLESIDLTHPISLGINPVVYYSTESGVDPLYNPIHADLSNIAIWSSTPPSNLAYVTAVAIDLSRYIGGVPFTFEPNEGTVVTLNMRAPYDYTLTENIAYNDSMYGVTTGSAISRNFNDWPISAVHYTQIKLLPWDIVIAKSSDPETGTEEEPQDVELGSTINYSIRVHNNDELTIQNIVMEDVIPNHLTINESVIRGFFGTDETTAVPISEIPRVNYTVIEQRVEWTISALGADEEFTLIIPTTVDPNLTQETTFINTARITSINGQSYTRYSEATYHIAEPPLPPPLLLLPEIVKSADEEPVYVGEDIDYTITVTNPNNVDLVGEFVVEDGLVDYVELEGLGDVVVTRTVDGVPVEMERGEDYRVALNTTTGVLTVTFYGLPGNSVTVITFTVEVTELPGGGYVPNIAVLNLPPGDENNFPPDTDREIPSEEVEVPVIEPPQPPPLLLLPEIVKSADEEPVYVGEDIDYTITVTNPNNVDLVGEFVVEDGLVDYVELEGLGDVVVTRTVDGVPVEMERGEDYRIALNTTTGVLTVTFYGLPGSSVTVITFTVEVTELPGGGYVPNIAVLNLPPGDENNFPLGTDREIPSEEVEVPVIESPQPPPLLLLPEIVKSADEEPVYVGEDIDYTITVTNPNNVDLVGEFIVEDGLVDYVVLEGLGDVAVTRTVDGIPVELERGEDYRIALNTTTGVLTVTFYGLPGSSVTVITFTVEVTELPGGGYVLNTAILSLPPGDGNNFPPGTPPEIPSEEVEVPVIEPPQPPPLLLLPEIVKSADEEPVYVGEDIDYTITVMNPNNVDLVGEFVVEDGLVDYVELEGLGDVAVTRTVDGVPVEMERGEDYRIALNTTTGVLTVTFYGLPGNSVTVITFTVEVTELPGGGYVLNTAILQLPPGDENNFPPGTPPEIPSEEVRVPVEEDPDSTLVPIIEKSADYTSPVYVGDTVEYTIIVRNPNEIDLIGDFVVEDRLVNYVELLDVEDIEDLLDNVIVMRDGIVLERGEDFLIDFNEIEGLLAVTFDGLPANSIMAIIFRVEVTEMPDSGYVLNTAILQFPPGDENNFPPGTPPEIPSEEVEVPVIEEDEPSVSIIKTAPSTAIAGDSITYTLRVTNTGNVILTDLLVTDTLPSELREPTNLVLPYGAIGEFTDDVLSVTLAALAPGESVYITFQATIYEEVEEGTVIRNEARVEEPNDDDVYDEDDSSTIVVEDEDPSVSITKTAPSTAIAGDLITYTLMVTNTGNVTLTDLLVTDTLPSELREPTNLVLPYGATGEFTDDVLSVTLAALAPGASVNISFQATIHEEVEAGTVIRNEARVEDPNDDDVYDEDDSLTTIAEDEDPSVSITKTAPSTALAGDSITYTLRVTNTGNVILTGLLVTDTLPSELNEPTNLVLPYGATGEFTDDVLSVTLAALAPGASVYITFQATVYERVETGTVIRNEARVEDPNDDDVYDEDDSSTTVVEDEDPSVSITKTAPSTALAGDLITYTLRVTNTGNVTLTDLLVTDTLPSELREPTSLVLPYGAIGEFTDDVLSVTLAALAPGASVNITFQATVYAGIEEGTVIRNVARVEDPNDDDVYDEDDSSTVVGEEDPSVSITKTAPSTAIAGDLITYTLMVTNTGNVALTDLLVTDTLPSELRNPTNLVLPYGAIGGFTDDALSVTLSALAPGASVNITFVATVYAGVEEGTVIRNVARVEDPSDDDVYDEDDSSTIVVEEEDPSVSITKTSQSTALAGDSITYTLRVMNTGNVSLTGLVVTDELPSQLENPRNVVLPAGAEGGFTGNILEVTLAILAPGSSVDITFVATVSDGVEDGTEIVNTAMVEDPNNEDVYDEDDSSTTVVGEEDPSVSITKTGQSRVLAGDSIIYKLRVTNTGNVSLTGLVVTDELPSQLENPRNVLLQAGAVGGFTGNILEVTLATLAPGSSVDITFVATVSESVEAGTVIVNTAVVEYPNDEDVHDEDSSSTTVVECLPCPPPPVVECPPDEDCPVEVECPPCPLCPPGYTATPETPRRPGNSGTPTLPNLPQTGAVVGISALAGTVIAASGLVAAKKRKKISSSDSIEQKHENEYNELFDA